MFQLPERRLGCTFFFFFSSSFTLLLLLSYDSYRYCYRLLSMDQRSARPSESDLFVAVDDGDLHVCCLLSVCVLPSLVFCNPLLYPMAAHPGPPAPLLLQPANSHPVLCPFAPFPALRPALQEPRARDPLGPALRTRTLEWKRIAVFPCSVFPFPFLTGLSLCVCINVCHPGASPPGDVARSLADVWSPSQPDRLAVPRWAGCLGCACVSIMSVLVGSERGSSMATLAMEDVSRHRYSALRFSIRFPTS